jgi:hypothetical protein
VRVLLAIPGALAGWRTRARAGTAKFGNLRRAAICRGCYAVLGSALLLEWRPWSLAIALRFADFSIPARSETHAAPLFDECAKSRKIFPASELGL